MLPLFSQIRLHQASVRQEEVKIPDIRLCWDHYLPAEGTNCMSRRYSQSITGLHFGQVPEKLLKASGELCFILFAQPAFTGPVCHRKDTGSDCL